MTGNQATYISVTFTESEIETSCVYAVDAIALHDARAWLAGQKKPTAEEMHQWLEKRGCRLGSPEGPALVRHFPDGSTEESYYKDGVKHRADGPAYVRRFASGTIQEEYYREGKLHRDEGPALVWYDPDGWTQELYYHNGAFIKQERLAPLSTVPGVSINCPALEKPDPPPAPGPA
jgi:hypothetical protein